jgi:hypothetical protein
LLSTRQFRLNELACILALQGTSERRVLLLIVNHTIDRRNRRASDYLQEGQRDRQTRSASSSSERLVVFLLCVVIQERMVQVATTTFRSATGVTAFCRIRSYLSTMQKQGHPMLSALMAVFHGQPLPVAWAPE